MQVRPPEPYGGHVRGMLHDGLITYFPFVMVVFDVSHASLRSEAVRHDRRSTASGQQGVLFFELSVPIALNQRGLRQALNLIAEELGLEMSLQHRDVFEAMHRLL